jgi:hypothetical protein
MYHYGNKEEIIRGSVCQGWNVEAPVGTAFCINTDSPLPFTAIMLMK